MLLHNHQHRILIDTSPSDINQYRLVVALGNQGVDN